jgi:hypothetical protein
MLIHVILHVLVHAHKLHALLSLVYTCPVRGSCLLYVCGSSDRARRCTHCVHFVYLQGLCTLA